MRKSSDLVREWRVLAAFTDDAGLVRPVAVDWKALKNSGRPAIAVIRIDGRLEQLNEQLLLAEIGAMLSHWRRSGAKIAGLEIDYDCGTARLAGYGRFLARLRGRMDPALRLSITALPAWLSSPELDAVFAPVSEAVLQVHMMQQPHKGLFDPKMARRWIDTMARRTGKPFMVALPDYGVRVDWREDGRMLAVEGERPLLAGGYSATEMIVSPEIVSGFLHDLAGCGKMIAFRSAPR
ncbi:MAG: DUF3142 domain-containing protein [Candidatus Binataceae bacterium]